MTGQATDRSRTKRLLVFAGALALASLAACTAKVDTGTQTNAEAAKALTAESQRHFRGPVGAVIDAARTHGELTADQKLRLDAISEDLDGDRDGRRELRQKLKASAVNVVRSGRVDSKEFDESVNEAAQAVSQRMQRSADAVEEIHLMLDAKQRAAVAAALRAQIEAKFGKEHRADARHRQGLQRFAQHLMLSRFQVDQLKAMKKELFGEKEQLRPSRDELLALADAFEGDDFSSAVESFRLKKEKLLRRHFAQAGKRTDAVLSLLTPEQRDLLADLIKDGPEKVLLGDKSPDPSAK